MYVVKSNDDTISIYMVDISFIYLYEQKLCSAANSHLHYVSALNKAKDVET